MGNKNNCIVDEISIDSDVKYGDNKNLKSKNNINNQKNKQSKIMERKKANSNLNLGISIFIFLIMAVIALYVILNKGNLGEYSLVYVNDSIHTAELECDTYFLSILDSESTGVALTVDGEKISDGFTLKSSNENIARIENNMVVVGDTEGTVTITAYFEKYDMNISTEIVAYIPINTITATVNSSVIKVGKETELDVNIVPRNGTDEYITFSSSDESIATVNQDGVVTGVSKGTVTITIEDELTGASGTKKITVK